MPSTYAVFGAGGKTGRECVKALLARGDGARAVVRDPAKYDGAWGDAAGDKLEVVAGDVTDPVSVAAALQGAAGAIFAASAPRGGDVNAVDDAGVGVVAAAAKDAAPSTPIVLISSALVSPHNRWHPIRLLLNNMRGPFSGQHIMDAKWRGEAKLRAAGVPYTIIRPGGLTDGPAGAAALLVAQGDRSAGRVARADVAAVAVAALTAPDAAGVSLELASDANKAASEGPTPDGVFAGLVKD